MFIRDCFVRVFTHSVVGRERRERVSQLAWCGGGCFDSRRRVNSTVRQLPMKMKSSFALALMLTFVAAIGAASPDCSVGDVRFACPKNFKQVPLEPTQQFGLYYWKKYNVGVFVAAPVAGYDES